MSSHRTRRGQVVWCLVSALVALTLHGFSGSGEVTAMQRGTEGEDSPRVIVILGSSTAAGTGASVPDSSWVGIFRAFVRSQDSSTRIINLAVGGYTTYDVMPSGYRPPTGRPAPKPSNNITYALTFRPRCLIINLPSNDAANGYPVSETLADYDTVLSRIPSGVQVWVTTTQPRNLDSAGRAKLIATRDSTPSRFGAHTLDFWSGLANPDGSLKKAFDSGDGVHLNNAGHRIIAERVITYCRCSISHY